MFAKLAEKLNSKLKNTEEEIEFKEYTKEEEVVETVETKETATVNASTPESNIELKVSDAELEARKAEMPIKKKENITGYLKRYSAMVSSADKGAIINR